LQGLSLTFVARMPIELILTGLLLIPAAIQVFYYLFVYSRFAFSRAKVVEQPEQSIPFSIIVCGRNEEDNFKKHLPKLLDQDYPEFEVVAVNDQSVDNSKDVLEELQNQFPHLRLVDVKENDRFWQGKKFGLTLGIKAAMYEHLLFTDADCEPVGKFWLQQMASGFYKPNKELVLGFGAYRKQGGLLNLLIRFETLFTATQYLSWALWGVPYMGVGRNLAYSKSLFFANNGFVPHMHLPMGDDDLFVNTASNRKNTTAVYNKESFTVSQPETTYAKWFRQKRRHLVTSASYKFRHKFMLGLFGASTVLFFASMLVMALQPGLPVWVWYAVGSRFLIQYLIFVFAARKTGDWDVLLLLPLLELFLLLNQLLIFVVNRFDKNHKWK
jgi:cellulose synthase/poly-beta-1,6-N-acetylglucosamine synthase-like glycosyltransferase